MTVSRNDRGLWDVQFYYKNFQGKTVKKHRRNFKTKKEAIEWVNNFLAQNAPKLDMTFSAFWQLYRSDMVERLRANASQHNPY